MSPLFTPSSAQKKQAAQIFAILQKLNPEPRTELHYKNNFQLLIAVILSAQTTDKQVNKATQNFFEHVLSPQDLLAYSLPQLEVIFKSIGLFRGKVKNILATAQILQQKYQGQVPQTFDELVSLPGVGEKTANVVLNTAFGQPTIAVDTHVHRLTERLFGLSFKTPSLVSAYLQKVVPTIYKQDAHHWLILHGRYICKAQKPKCLECPLMPLCKSQCAK